MNIIPSILLPIIANRTASTLNLFEIMKGKKVIIFGVPGAFTPTCSEKHLPGFIKLSDKIKSKGVDDIYCLSVNDVYVMKSWLFNYTHNEKIIGIADGNAEFSKLNDLSIDKSSSFMGMRCKRFAMIINNNEIKKKFIEEAGQFVISSAEHILSEI